MAMERRLRRPRGERMLVGLVPHISATALAAAAQLTGAGPRRSKLTAQIGGDAGPIVTATLVRVRAPHGGHRWLVRCSCGAIRWRLHIGAGSQVGCRGCLMGRGLSYVSWAWSRSPVLRDVLRPLRGRSGRRYQGDASRGSPASPAPRPPRSGPEQRLLSSG